MLKPAIQRVIPGNHPSLAGHFPGNPIVPGVVLLEEVVDALAEWGGNCRLQGIPSVKFVAPLQPDQVFTIHLSTHTGQRVKFRCTLPDGQLLAQGQLAITPC
jgi:3-hydroxyacyl-[acyl-carrier-protein] dehydratase